MSLYALFTNFNNTKSSLKTSKSPLVEKVNKEISNAGANLIAQFDNFQHYDVVDVIEANDKDTVVKAMCTSYGAEF